MSTKLALECKNNTLVLNDLKPGEKKHLATTSSYENL